MREVFNKEKPFYLWGQWRIKTQAFFHHWSIKFCHKNKIYQWLLRIRICNKSLSFGLNNPKCNSIKMKELSMSSQFKMRILTQLLTVFKIFLRANKLKKNTWPNISGKNASLISQTFHLSTSALAPSKTLSRTTIGSFTLVRF